MCLEVAQLYTSLGFTLYSPYVCLLSNNAGPPPRGVIARPADVHMMDAAPPFPPPPGGMDGDQQLQRPAKGAVISGKSTVVPLPKAHEDKRGECHASVRGNACLGISSRPTQLHGELQALVTSHLCVSLCCSHGSGAGLGACAARAGAGPAAH